MSNIRPEWRKDFERYARLYLTYAMGRTDREALDRFFAWIGERYAPSSYRTIWSIVRALFKSAGIPWPYARYEAPADDELAAFRPMRDAESIRRLIAAACQPRFSRLGRFYLAAATVYGCRRTELARLAQEHIDLKANLLFIPTRHGGRPRYHLIPDAIRPVVEQARPLLVPHSLKWFDRTIQRIEKRAGITHVGRTGWHAIRRALVYYLRRSGLTDDVIEHFMRWRPSGQRMVKRYGQATAVVGVEGVSRTLPLRDEDVDRQVFAVHPFLPVWHETLWRAG